MTLTDDEVRERFSPYHDGELSPAESAAVRARLDASPALAKEYEAFRRMISGLSAIGGGADESAAIPQAQTEPGVPRVDLLASVQARLHKRSGGRFYGTRWSRRAGVLPLEAMAAVVLVILLVAYVCLTYVSGLEPVGPPAGASPPPPAVHTR